MSTRTKSRKAGKADKVSYRRMREADQLEAEKMFLRSYNHLRKQANLPQFKGKISRPNPMLLHFLRSDPEGHFVAVNEAGRIVGYASSIIREMEWYLAMLFVLPSYQTAGVGRELLTRTMKYGAKAECTRYALATFAYNPQAIAVYSKQGMPPQATVLQLDRKQDPKMPIKLKPSLELAMKEVTSERAISRLTRLDRKVRGTARPEEHFFWLSTDGFKVLEFREGRKFAGYAMMSRSGMIGPVAATRPEYLQPILVNCLLSDFFTDAIIRRVFVHGEQKELLAYLLDAGFRITEPLLVMTSERFSDPQRYMAGTLAHY